MDYAWSSFVWSVYVWSSLLGAKWCWAWGESMFLLISYLGFSKEACQLSGSLRVKLTHSAYDSLSHAKHSHLHTCSEKHGTCGSRGLNSFVCSHTHSWKVAVHSPHPSNSFGVEWITIKAGATAKTIYPPTSIIRVTHPMAHTSKVWWYRGKSTCRDL